jgi:hypothetical protein
MLKAALPVLLNVIVWVELASSMGSFPKFRVVVERPTTGFVLLPVPERVAVWGLPVALSVSVTEAAKDPLAAGLNVTLTVQLAPAATLAPQLLLCAKSPGFAPVSVMLLMLKAALPVLLSVKVWAELVVPTAWLPKARVVGERLATGFVLAPVPERVAVWGLPVALSVRVTEAAKDPLAAGMNVTLTVQLAPAATLAPQLLLCAKSPGFAPVSVMLLMLKAALPVLLSVKVWAELVVPTAWLPKARAVGEKLAVGCPAPTPVPDKEMLRVRLRPL